MKQKFNVTGMTCSACSAHVDKAVRKLDGVKECNVNLLANNMTVEYDDGKLSADVISKAVEEAGYGAFPIQKQQAGVKKNASERIVSEAEIEMKSMKKRFLYSILFLIPLMYVSMGHMVGLPLPSFLSGLENGVSYGMTQFLLTLPIMYLNRAYYERGFKSLRSKAPNMDALIAIGSLAAVLYGIFAIYRMGYGLGHNDMDLVHRYHMDLYFESAGTILTLITLGKYLETRSKGKTKEAISKLMDLTPKTAMVIRDGVEEEIPVEEVQVGDLLAVRSGQQVPVDGMIVEGNGSIDQSALTGESIPVDKVVGDKVMGATINRSGFFKFRAEKVGDDTAISQIIALVEEASGSKAPIAKLADKISGIFVPVVIGIAIVAMIVWLLLGQPFEFALSIGIAVLVISCPCALGLATPVAIMVGTGRGAEEGILIKSAEALETAHSVQTVVLDKTGTITEGKPKVTDVIPADGMSEMALLEIAGIIEEPSEHPLSNAIVEEAKVKELKQDAVEQFETVAGKGIKAVYKGVSYFAGNESFLQENKIDVSSYKEQSNMLAEQGKTPLYFAKEGAFLGIIAVADVIKETSAAAIQTLKDMGIEVVMLTGDNARTGKAVQKQLHLDRVVAEVLPQDKEREVRLIQESGRKVAMVGDGINDAPALARADVGIAIGAGTDVAMESADIVLMKNDLQDVASAVQLSKAVMKNIKENLFWAFFYNSIGIPLAAGVFFSILNWKLNPMFGSVAMSLSSFCVVTNALRLKMFKPKKSAVKPVEGQQISERVSRLEAQKENQLKENNSNKNKKEKGENKMQKVVTVEGMMCGHCQAHVEKALKGVTGVADCKVDLEAKKATVTLKEDVADDVLMNAVKEAGYEPVSVTE